MLNEVRDLDAGLNGGLVSVFLLLWSWLWSHDDWFHGALRSLEDMRRVISVLVVKRAISGLLVVRGVSWRVSSSCFEHRYLAEKIGAGSVAAEGWLAEELAGEVFSEVQKSSTPQNLNSVKAFSSSLNCQSLGIKERVDLGLHHLELFVEAVSVVSGVAGRRSVPCKHAFFWRFQEVGRDCIVAWSILSLDPFGSPDIINLLRFQTSNPSFRG